MKHRSSLLMLAGLLLGCASAALGQPETMGWGNVVGIRFGEVVAPSAPYYQVPSSFSFISHASPTNVTLTGVVISGNTKAQLLNLISGLTLAGQQISY